MRYLLSSGKGAALPSDDPLAGARLLAVADTDGDLREARIRRAAPVAQRDLEELFGERIEEVRVCEWLPRERAVSARHPPDAGGAAAGGPDLAGRARRGPRRGDGRRRAGARDRRAALDARRAAASCAGRLRAAAGEALPDWSDAALLDTLDDWLTPHLGRLRSAAELDRLDLSAILAGTLDWAATQALDRAAPAHFTAPTGTKAPVDYDRDPPVIAIRVQELFGLDAQPAICGGRLPLTVELLSPAGRPVQTTGDLPGFWRSGWSELRKEMRGRYPKHPWPEDPLNAEPTRRAKPRG